MVEQPIPASSVVRWRSSTSTPSPAGLSTLHTSATQVSSALLPSTRRIAMVPLLSAELELSPGIEGFEGASRVHQGCIKGLSRGCVEGASRGSRV